MWKPNIQLMSTVIRIQNRTETVVNGCPEINFTDIDPNIHFCNWKGRGGTESVQSGSLVVEDTAEINMWYHPEILVTGRILTFKRNLANPTWNELIETWNNEDLTWLDEWPISDEYYNFYEIVNVENIEMRNQFLVLKVRRVVNA